MNEQTKMKLTICGADYSIVTDDSEEYIASIGQDVDKRMTELMRDNPRLSITMAAVLSALSYCDECHKANDSADNLRAQIKDYLEDSSKARIEAEESRREVERLKRELQSLRIRISEMEDR